MTTVYTLTSEMNAADTWRDEDNIITEQLGVFSSVEKAKQVIIDRYESISTGYSSCLKWWEDKKGNIVGTSGGSYAEYYTIAKQEVQ